MDWSKYPLEKLVYFVASVIPGFTVLLAARQLAPGNIDRLFWIAFLGYKTKLTIAFFIAFVIGYSVVTLLRAVIGGVYGGYRGAFPLQFRPYHLYDVAPWRDPRWRALLKNYLGAKAPADTELITSELYDLGVKRLNLYPEPERPRALYELSATRIETEMNDASWGAWYDHFHELVLKPNDRDWFFHLRWGLNINFEAAALIVLVGSLYIPSFRHWWSILPSVMWSILLMAEEYSAFREHKDHWSTLSKQIELLLETQPIPLGT